MRFIFQTALWLAPLLLPSLTSTRAIETPSPQPGIEVLEYKSDTSYTKFTLPCAACSEADESTALVFDLVVFPTNDFGTSNLALNAHKLDLTWEDSVVQSFQSISAFDTSGAHHSIDFKVTGVIDKPAPGHFHLFGEHATQNIRFEAISVDGDPNPRLEFVVIMRFTEQQRLVGLISDWTPEQVHFYDGDSYSISDLPNPSEDSSTEVPEDRYEGSDFDVAAEIQELGLLEAKAHDLQVQITEKKQAISRHTREHQKKLCLKHLIQECDGVLCAAKAIAQRICDHVGIDTEPTLGYARMKTQHLHDEIALAGVPTHVSEVQASTRMQSMNKPLFMTKGDTVHILKDLSIQRNPVMKVLSVIAAALGLTTLFALIRRKCMSPRTRQERAADLEERRNARAYRRAARRALMRKRWDNFVNAISCFRREEESRIEDYEEKRALILQDAFLEQELDQAEKGEVMEAEIRELRNAHEIVSSLVRVDENRYELVTPIHDPPPPMVPLPFTPISRSRASSGTLPSYTSESLPDYTSRPGDGASESGDEDNFTPPTTDEPTTASSSDRHSSDTSSHSSHTGYTPTSSILETSPRASEETLRTRQSRDTRRS